MKAHLTAKEEPIVSTKKSNSLLCPQCGGNGYTKSAPNCRQTCLECFGRGILPHTFH